MRTVLLLILLAASAACAGSGAPGGDDDDGNGADGGGNGLRDAGPPDADYGECEPAEAGGFTYVKIATWRDDAKAAYSMIHDDMCGPGLRGIDQYAVPALEQHGLSAALAPFVQACEEGALWDMVRSVEAQGNEIVSHSYSHPSITLANAPMEVVMAKSAFDAQIATPISFYIFPYDFFTAETIAAVGSAGHIGARAGNRDDNDGFDLPPINLATPGKDLEIEFDVWPRNYSKYALYYPADILSVHVWNAIEKGGWAVREFHSVIPDDLPPADQGFGPVPLSIYQQHLDFLVDAWKSNQVWTTTPSTAIRYRHARTACKASVSGSTISFDASAAECQTFHTPVSVIVKAASDLPRIDAVQGGVRVSARKIGPSTFSVTADPTLGDVSLSGCSNAGPTVEPVTIAPRPMPAASVCDIEKVTGSGSPGKMDDLERPIEEFQVLPNPSQADGRTGSWSWYPQNVTVKQEPDGATTVLKYAGAGLAAWSGVTLAFLGGNGAGACYDATAYTGIRFKIRGSVVSTDELNGKMILSVVTAETQSRRYGGDLNGEGGHFHKVIPVTASWSTVQISWAELAKPTWGATAVLAAPAVGKLQALDWGVSDKTTSFEVFIDDIELY